MSVKFNFLKKLNNDGGQTLARVTIITCEFLRRGSRNYVISVSYEIYLKIVIFYRSRVRKKEGSFFFFFVFE